MPMDWSSERYVRIYTRNTLTWLRWCWQARLVFPSLARAVDRAGLLHVGRDPAEGLALVLQCPPEVCLAALHGDSRGTGLLSPDPDGGRATVELHGSVLVIPNHIAAQEARATDAQRQRDHRERLRDIASGSRVFPELVQPAKPAGLLGQMSHEVTGGHDSSQAVTPYLAEPADLKNPPTPPRGERLPAARKPRTKRGPISAFDEVVERVIERLNQRSATTFLASGRATRTVIEALLLDGFTEDDLRVVVWHRAVLWGSDPKMREWLRPSTLFRPSNFEQYLPQAIAAWKQGHNGRPPEGCSAKALGAKAKVESPAPPKPDQPLLLKMEPKA